MYQKKTVWVVQMNFTPEIEILYMLSIFSMTSLKKHMKYCIIMFGKCLIVLAHLMSKFVRSCVALTRSSSGIHRSLSEMGRHRRRSHCASWARQEVQRPLPRAFSVHRSPSSSSFFNREAARSFSGPPLAGGRLEDRRCREDGPTSSPRRLPGGRTDGRTDGGVAN